MWSQLEKRQAKVRDIGKPDTLTALAEEKRFKRQLWQKEKAF
jgi:hypothetical protein